MLHLKTLPLKLISLGLILLLIGFSGCDSSSTSSADQIEGTDCQLVCQLVESNEGPKVLVKFECQSNPNGGTQQLYDPDDVPAFCGPIVSDFNEILEDEEDDDDDDDEATEEDEEE